MNTKRNRVVNAFLLLINFLLLSCAAFEEVFQEQPPSEGINLVFVGNRIDLRNPMPRSGEEVEVFVTIRNLGNKPAKGIPVSFYDNHLLFFTTEINLEPGRQHDLIVGWRAAPGHHILSVVIDPAHQFKERLGETSKVERSVLVR